MQVEVTDNLKLKSKILFNEIKQLIGYLSLKKKGKSKELSSEIPCLASNLKQRPVTSVDT